MSAPMTSTCRFCSAPLGNVIVDLGMSPLANSYVAPNRNSEMEPFYPLRLLVCDDCLLVQVEDVVTPEHIFSEYHYFSSYSTTWLEHSRRYAEAAIGRFGLDDSSRVVELASNDGYLLQYFLERQIPVLGIEPAANVAKVALQKGIPTLVEFFGEATARTLTGEKADLLIGNNVIAHVPDLNDFVAGMTLMLKPRGQLSLEFSHFPQLVERKEWDTIYHEHFSYFTCATASKVLAAHGFRLFDVEELPTHGGSLRIYGCHADDPRPTEPRVAELLEREATMGYDSTEVYAAFGQRVAEDKRQIVQFLIELKDKGNRIVGYGAPAKGNTLLNYCGLGTDFLEYTCDLNPHKQGHFLPGTHIPIYAPEVLQEDRPDIVLILSWNLKDEIIDQLAFIRTWGGRFAARAPDITLFS